MHVSGPNQMGLLNRIQKSVQMKSKTLVSKTLVGNHVGSGFGKKPE